MTKVIFEIDVEDTAAMLREAAKVIQRRQILNSISRTYLSKALTDFANQIEVLAKESDTEITSDDS